MIYVEPSKIRAMMTARKRQLLRPDDRTKADFPKWERGWTTKHYIQIFSIRNPLPKDWLTFADREAPYYTGPEVTVETIAE